MPFDGTKAEIERFLDSLNGYEKYIFDAFPRFTGSLHFSGSSGTSGGNSISVADTKGTVFSWFTYQSNG